MCVSSNVDEASTYRTPPTSRCLVLASSTYFSPYLCQLVYAGLQSQSLVQQVVKCSSCPNSNTYIAIFKAPLRLSQSCKVGSKNSNNQVLLYLSF